jgi:hypothetical protein
LALLENENSDVADNNILFAEVPRTAENAWFIDAEVQLTSHIGPEMLCLPL